MMWRRRGELSSVVVWSVMLVAIMSAGSCDGARRRVAQRRSDTRSSELPDAVPSAETLQALAEAMGAAGFEHHTEGRPLVKRLIPTKSQSEFDVVEHLGVIGKAGVDFPAYPNIPNTGFNCKNVPTGYYADLETDCQVFHICDTSRKISFLCPNGTIFSQSHLICDWWFKVDCASSPALYESSAEYYSNEQKKSQKITQSLSKNADLQHLADASRAESRRTSVNIPSTTERLFRHRQRLHGEIQTPKATSRSFQAFFPDSAFNPTQRTQTTTTFDKRRKNLVQLISNNFGNNPVKTTLPTYTDASTYRTTQGGDFNGLREMQVAAESASFASNNNRQFLQDYNKNFRPYPVYTANVQKSSNTKGNPTLTTLYSFQDKNLNQIRYESTTTKRPTLLPYTKSYTTVNEKREPYTRPGISLLKDFLEKEKNKTATTTENIVKATARSDIHNNLENKITIESKNSFESVTRIPQTARTVSLKDTSDKFDAYYSTNQETQATTEPNYQERRERLIRKLNLDKITPTEPTEPTERYYGDQPNRPGLVVPPSLTPKTLHSLAIYYATAIDNLSTALPTDETESSTPNYINYEVMEEALPALFSQHTINKYSSLFSEGASHSELLNEIKLAPNGTYNELADDLAVQQSQNPIASSPQIRELAQVFTHALSAYLQDPVQFRKVLSDIRPTPPSFGDMLTSTDESYNTEPTTTVNEEDDEILGFSDDNKVRPALASLRDGKALNIGSDSVQITMVTYEPTTTPKAFTTDVIPTTYRATTYKHPFKCCGKISASYTSASTPSVPFTSPISYNTATNVNTLENNKTESYTTTEDSYSAIRFGGFQNNTQSPNNSPYGKGATVSEPLSEYVEATNLPAAWGVDTTSGSVTNAHTNVFESKKIRPTTAIPTTTQVYFTETDSVELENEEELQRAHSQSFVQPQNQRQGKNSKLDIDDNIIRKPSEDLEAPSVQDTVPTTVQATTQVPTIKYDNEVTTASSIANGIYTSSDNQDATQYQWPTTYGSWQSTIVDPITLNDGLSHSVPEHLSQLVSQTNSWLPNAASTPAFEYTATSEQSYSPSSHIELTTPGNINDERFGRVLKELTSTEPNANQDLTTIAETVVEKAKEIMGGMNATTTEKLMNVMKKTKSKTVRRLILLLVQTCDDDHNSTAEASKRALLEALMTVSQKDIDEIAKEEGVTDYPTTANGIYVDTFKATDFKRNDETGQEVMSARRGKSLDFDPSAINALSNPTTTDNPKPTEPSVEYTTIQSPRTSITTSRRGVKKFLVRTSQLEPKSTASPFVDSPRAEARVAAQETEVKTTSDTRALELLRSLYSIAAKWG